MSSGISPDSNMAVYQALPARMCSTCAHSDLPNTAGLLPDERAVDAGYTSADLLLDARARGITLLGPLLADTSPQARAGGYTAEAFTIDWDNRQVTCPQGATSIA